MILFVVVTTLPAAALVALGLLPTEQERALGAQRRRESLDRAADQAVRTLEQELLRLGKRHASRASLSRQDEAVGVRRR